MKNPFRTNARRAFLALAVISAAAAGAVFFLLPARQASYVPYAEFRRMVEGGTVERAKFDGARIYFRADVHAPSEKDGGGAPEYPVYTDNPYSPTLREELLLGGASVESAATGGEIVSLVLDSLFYVLFFGAIAVAFRKFISPKTFRLVRRTGVSFADVVGMDELKRYMAQVVDVMKHPAGYAARGVRIPRGIILEGAPGNGKTLFARALAGEARVPFIAAKATDFESMFMAIGPMKVKLLFRTARRHAPCIVFIDEFDGIGTRRNYSGSAIETENTRIVTALLNELDGFEPNAGVLVVAATNSVAALDEALIRPGRFDARATVPYPDRAAREALCAMYLRGKPHDPGVTAPALAARLDGASCAAIEAALNEAALRAAQSGRTEFSMDDVRA